MREWLALLTEAAVLTLDLLALLVIVIGSLQAVAGMLRLLRRDDGVLRRDVWLHYARWLVAGLTFQLAADILETAISSDWQAIARVAAVAAIRTFLNFFLERDVAEMQARQRERAAA